MQIQSPLAIGYNGNGYGYNGYGYNGYGGAYAGYGPYRCDPCDGYVNGYGYGK